MSRTCMLNVWNKRIFLMVSYVQSLLANFVSAHYLTTALQHGRHKNKKKNQLLFVYVTSRPNLLCFGFDHTQSQISKPISRNGYGPNCKLFFGGNWRDSERIESAVLLKNLHKWQQSVTLTAGGYVKNFKFRSASHLPGNRHLTCKSIIKRKRLLVRELFWVIHQV